MKRIAGWTIAALAAAGMASAGWAADPFDGIPSLTFRYYDVSGETAEEINRALRELGPRSHGGDVGAGRTDYHIAYGWVEMRGVGSCRVTDIKVSFSAVIHLPRLTNAARLPPPMLREWHKLSNVLRVHEAGHAGIAYDHVDEVREAIIGAPCGKERARAKLVLDRVDRLQADYDRRTNHGEAQGDILR